MIVCVQLKGCRYSNSNAWPDLRLVSRIKMCRLAPKTLEINARAWYWKVPQQHEDVFALAPRGFSYILDVENQIISASAEECLRQDNVGPAEHETSSAV